MRGCHQKLFLIFCFQKMSCAQCCARVFGCAHRVQLYVAEDKEIGDVISHHNKKFMIMRAYNLFVVCFIEALNLAWELTDTYLVYIQIPYQFDEFYYIALTRIIFATITATRFLCILLSAVSWSNYRFSSTCIVVAYYVATILPCTAFYVPYMMLTDNYIVLAVVMFALIATFVEMMQPCILSVHNIIMQAYALANYYPHTRAFRGIAMAMCIFYIIFCTIIAGGLYQLDGYIQGKYDFGILVTLAAYTIAIFAPAMISHQFARAVQYLCIVGGAILAYFALQRYGINLFVLAIRAFINNMFTGRAISDQLIIIVTYFTRSKHAEFPHNLYARAPVAQQNDRAFIELAEIVPQ
jgi:hypothetical protein